MHVNVVSCACTFALACEARAEILSTPLHSLELESVIEPEPSSQPAPTIL